MKNLAFSRYCFLFFLKLNSFSLIFRETSQTDKLKQFQLVKMKEDEHLNLQKKRVNFAKGNKVKKTNFHSEFSLCNRIIETAICGKYLVAKTERVCLANRISPDTGWQVSKILFDCEVGNFWWQSIFTQDEPKTTKKTQIEKLKNDKVPAFWANFWVRGHFLCKGKDLYLL